MNFFLNYCLILNLHCFEIGHLDAVHGSWIVRDVSFDHILVEFSSPSIPPSFFLAKLPESGAETKVTCFLFLIKIIFYKSLYWFHQVILSRYAFKSISYIFIYSIKWNFWDLLYQIYFKIIWTKIDEIKTSLQRTFCQTWQIINFAEEGKFFLALIYISYMLKQI